MEKNHQDVGEHLKKKRLGGFSIHKKIFKGFRKVLNWVRSENIQMNLKVEWLLMIFVSAGGF